MWYELYCPALGHVPNPVLYGKSTFGFHSTDIM